VKNIKTLGIATVMALALIAFAGAASASANYFQGSATPEAVNGSLTGKAHNLLLNGESFTCSGVAFSGGEILGKTGNQVTVTPELTSCSHNNEATSWVTNGCKFRFNPGNGSLVGWIDIVGCETPMSNNSFGCLTKIGNQNGVGTVTYQNGLSGGVAIVTAVANLNSITFTRSGGPCLGGPLGTFNNGTYTGEWIMKGSTKGVPANLEVVSTTPPANTNFVAEEAPVTISGVGTGTNTRMKPMAGNMLACESYSLSGTSASASAESISLVPSYKGCKVGGETVPDNFVSAGGCSYVFHVNGKFDIAGATCASNPITLTRAGCIVTIGPQSGLPGVGFWNQGSGKLRTVSVIGTAENVVATAVGPSCPSPGVHADGKILSSAKLTATNASGALQGFSVE